MSARILSGSGCAAQVHCVVGRDGGKSLGESAGAASPGPLALDVLVSCLPRKAGLAGLLGLPGNVEEGLGVDVDEGGAAAGAVEGVAGGPGCAGGEGAGLAGAGGGGDFAGVEDAVVVGAQVGGQGVAGAGAVQLAGEDAELVRVESGQWGVGGGEVAGGGDAP